MSNHLSMRSSCSYSSPINEDVKPNVLIRADVPARISHPPPGFSQSCNHKILVSKSFDCKTGMTQVDNLRNAPNHAQQSSTHRANHYDAIPNGRNNVPNTFESCERGLVSEIPFYQSSLSHNSHSTSQLSNHQICTNNLNNQADNITHALSQNLTHSWQQPPRTPFFNSPPQTNPLSSSLPHRLETSINSRMMLPPLNVPPPSFTPYNSSSIKLHSYAQTSLGSNLICKSSTNACSQTPLQNGSNLMHAPFSVPPPNLFPNIASTPDVLSSHLVNRHLTCDFQVDFNVPPPSFVVPPPKLSNSYPMPPLSRIKTETPNNYFVNNSSSTVIDNFSGHSYNSERPSSNLNPSFKETSSRSELDSDYYGRNRVIDSANSMTTRNDSQPGCSNTTANNVCNSFKQSSSRYRRSMSKEKYNTDGKRRDDRYEHSNSRNEPSRSRTRESSRSRSTRSPSHSVSRRPKRTRSRSRSRQTETERKRNCTRRSRSRSKSRQTETERKRHCTTRRSRSRHRDSSSSRSRNNRTEMRNSKPCSKSRSRSVSKPCRRSRSRTSERPSENLSSLEKWRMNNCCSEREITEKFNTQAAMEVDQIIEQEKKIWTRSAPADLYYVKRKEDNSHECTEKTHRVIEKFKSVVQKIVSTKERKAPFDYTANRKKIKRKCSHCGTKENNSSDSDDSGEEASEEDTWMLELQLKQKHPDRLHPELWFNDKGEMNDGPLCRCSTKSRRSGIRHNIYAGEEKQEYCNPETNNVDKLYHYRVTVSPPTNFLINKPTVIEHDNHEFIFEGFSLFSHHPLEKLPTCRVIRFNIQYTIVYIEEKVPEGFSVGETELFFNYLFHEVLELVDLDLKSDNDKDGCPQFHIMPRFVRELKDNGKELLPMYSVLEYFTSSFVPVISEEMAKEKDELSTYDWQDFADGVKGMIIVKLGAKPCAMRVDQLDRESETKDIYPDAVHFGSRPLQLCFAGSPEFQKLWKAYVKLRHLVANKPKRTDEDKRRLAAKEQKLQEMRTNTQMKRGVTVAISSRGFHRTGIMCDMVQHAMLIPVLICHLRFHRSLNVLEERIEYKFKNRYLLQLALTHPSYRENFGTNPDHARNSLSNCGVRQPEYGDRRIHFQNTRKRGINTLINIMSKLGRKVATESNITHNERLEFLGDAVVEFITSIHLFHVFPDIEEGGLATYRAAIVQNQHLAHLAKKLGLEDFMLYAHGSDLCHEVELKHAMANCFEALMGALFLDGGIDVADKVFSCVLYKDDEARFKQWMNYPKHPLQEQEPAGDRQWVKQSPLLRKLQYLEYSSGVIFHHIRLLARVFTTRSMGFTLLTLGSNQRLEFLGDTVLQLITSDYLYNHFPEHHEGHLSLLRSSLVNNRTQSVVCNDIGMPFFANMINPKTDLKMKDRADLLEAFLGAMYIDKGMEACVQFCKVCFFPRLQYFILNQEWNDPKSKLQQCCLTLRTLDGGEPDIPIYKVIEHVGPTNSRSYTVAVYFKNERLAKATGNSIQQAEMNAAKVALEKCPSICPQLDHQKRVIAKSLEMQKYDGVNVP